MKKYLCLIVLFFVMIFECGCSLSESNLNCHRIVIAEDMNVTGIASVIKPAIVGIQGVSDSGESVGSGVCVASGGFVLTNSHVIHDCYDIILYLSNGEKSNADIIYEDTINDLAIIRSTKNLPYLSLGDSDELQVGEDVLAVGTPLSLTLVHSFTKGIISALNRTLKVGSSNGEGYMQNLIQHDASLNPGNSGGPLINSRGEVVGINTLKISGGEGIGFAIPSKSFKSLLSNYVSKINYKAPYLGVYGLDGEIAKFQGVSNIDNGFYVINVAENSPLKKLGLESQSTIIEINNRPIKNTLDLKDELYKLGRGEMSSIKFVKDNQIFSAKFEVC